MTEKPSQKYTVEDALRLTIKNLRVTDPSGKVRDFLDKEEASLNTGSMIIGPKVQPAGFRKHR